MDKVAILVDGGFYLRQAKRILGDNIPAKESADILHAYCTKHLYVKNGAEHCRDDLYRIFYYDCPPLERNVYHPLLKKDKSLKKEPLYTWMTEFHDALRNKRKVALRMGRLSENGIGYTLRPDVVKKLCNGALSFDQLTELDFYLSTQQKGVDMRIGIDISSMAYKHQVSKMILISGDSDFVPAAKLARREGIDFVLDPMGASISSDLNEHVDGISTPRLERKKSFEDMPSHSQPSDPAPI